MFNNRRNFSGLVVIFEIVLCVIGIVATKLDNDLVKQNIFSMKRVNIPNSISEILSHNNWTNNQDCLIELNAIQTGIENGERWAIQGRLTTISFCELYCYQIALTKIL